MNFQLPYLLLINGKQGSGKSHFLRWLMRENSLSDTPFDFGVVLPILHLKDLLNISQKYIYDVFDHKVVDNLMKLQAGNVKKKINLINNL